MATRLVPTLYQAVDANGDPADGYKLYFYETGTVVLKDTFSDTALTVANANPVICNSDGRPANGAGDPVDIFGVNKEDFKVVLTTDADVVVVTDDPIDTITYDINSFSTRPKQHWGTTTGTADAFLIKPDPSITAYTATIIFSLQCHLDNNAGSTLAVFEEGTVSTYLAALAQVKYDNAGAKTALEAGDNQAGQTYDYRLDGTDAVCLNPGIVENLKANDVTINEKLNIQSNAVTIASGAFAYSGARQIVDGEGAAADDLVTISGMSAGDMVIISSANDARDITIKHGTGNIETFDSQDVICATTKDRWIGQYDGSTVVELSRAIAADTYPICKAWVSFNGATAAIEDSYNVSGVVRNSAGNYTVSFTKNMPNANYAVISGGGVTTAGSTQARVAPYYDDRAVGSVVIINEINGQFVPQDLDFCSVTIFSTF